MTTDDRIAARRAQLEHALAAIPPDERLPATATREDLLRNQAQRHAVTRQLATLDAAVAACRALGSAEADERWRADLLEWRVALCDELLTIASPIRDTVTMGRNVNLTLSIKCVDRGPDRTLHDSGYDLTTLRLGQLMRAAGYDFVLPPDPQRNFGGQMPWFGSLPEVERRMAALATKRAQAEAALDAGLLTDDERAAQEADAKQLREAFNSLRVKHGPDASEPCLVAYRNGEVLPLDEMTPLQRQAFEAADAAFRAERRPREEAVTN